MEDQQTNTQPVPAPTATNAAPVQPVPQAMPAPVAHDGEHVAAPVPQANMSAAPAQPAEMTQPAPAPQAVAAEPVDQGLADPEPMATPAPVADTTVSQPAAMAPSATPANPVAEMSAPQTAMPATQPAAAPAQPAEMTQSAPAEMQAPDSAAPVAAMPEESAPTKTNKKGTKILVVEDEIDARTMFVDLLTSEGYETSSGVDGVDALAKAAADKYHLILLDIVMPNKDGIEVLQEIKNNPDKYGTPIVVMLTNISGDAAVEKAMELGAAGFRLKVDTEPTQLLADVADFLNGKVQNIEQEPVTKTMA